MQRKYLLIVVILLISMIFTSCENTTSADTKTLDSGFIPAKVGMYDCADTAIVAGKNTKDKTITFFNIVMKRNYTLNYDGTSKLLDKYNNSLSMEQVSEGDIVDLTFLKSKKKLNSLQMSTQSWKLEDVANLELLSAKKQMKVSDSIYTYTNDLFIFSNGVNAQIMDINQCDKLNIQGIGHTIYSIAIDKGHGYLRLKNDEYFIGGWIEVGQEIIKTISEDMLLVVPEGTYNVLISTKGASGTKSVTIERDEETELDIGDLKGEEIKKYGNLLFALTPDTATLYMDGEEVDTSAPYQIEYGIHQMMAKADGYQTVVQYIKVGQENATIQVTLEKQGSDEDNSVSANSTSSLPQSTNTSSNASVSSNTPVSTAGYKVTINAPTGAEVYIDGNYVGIAPISYTKVEGIHVVTLRKTGYSTRSYTIHVDGEEKDASFSFSDLTAIE